MSDRNKDELMAPENSGSVQETLKQAPPDIRQALAAIAAGMISKNTESNA